jgi:hypothetical protein
VVVQVVQTAWLELLVDLVAVLAPRVEVCRVVRAPVAKDTLAVLIAQAVPIMEQAAEVVLVVLELAEVHQVPLVELEGTGFNILFRELLLTMPGAAEEPITALPPPTTTLEVWAEVVLAELSIPYSQALELQTLVVAEVAELHRVHTALEVLVDRAW